eukprot:326799_1
MPANQSRSAVPLLLVVVVFCSIVSAAQDPGMESTYTNVESNNYEDHMSFKKFYDTNGIDFKHDIDTQEESREYDGSTLNDLTTRYYIHSNSNPEFLDGDKNEPRDCILLDYESHSSEHRDDSIPAETFWDWAERHDQHSLAGSASAEFNDKVSSINPATLSPYTSMDTTPKSISTNTEYESNELHDLASMVNPATLFPYLSLDATRNSIDTNTEYEFKGRHDPQDVASIDIPDPYPLDMTRKTLGANCSGDDETKDICIHQGRYYTSSTSSETVEAHKFYYHKHNSLPVNGRMEVGTWYKNGMKNLWITWQDMYDSAIPSLPPTPPFRGKDYNVVSQESNQKQLKFHKRVVGIKPYVGESVTSNVSSKLPGFDAQNSFYDDGSHETEPQHKGFMMSNQCIWIVLLFVLMCFVLRTLSNASVRQNNAIIGTPQYFMERKESPPPAKSRSNAILIAVVSTTAAAALGSGAMACYRYHTHRLQENLHFDNDVPMAAPPAGDVNSGVAPSHHDREGERCGEESVSLAENDLQKFYNLYSRDEISDQRPTEYSQE